MRLTVALLAFAALAGISAPPAPASEPLQAGFAAIDITPDVENGRRIYLAGYGMNRKATGIHDRLYARTVVFSHGSDRIALVSVDLVGLQYPAVKAVREQLADFRYVLVASTHNHEGPDVIGIWGKGPFSRGVDDEYVKTVVQRVVASVKQAAEHMIPVTGSYGTAEDATLLADTRLPDCRDGVLRAVRLNRAGTRTPAGIIVQWNCHPESLGAKNQLITADFPWATLESLEQKYGCPVVYFSGAVGGLMTHPTGRLKSQAGEELSEGTFEFAKAYGRAVADLAEKALEGAQNLELSPLHVAAQPISVPVQNSLYRAARAIGVMQREGLVWTGDFQTIGVTQNHDNADKPSAVESEVVYLRLGELHIAGVPGELYPELVHGQFEQPPALGVDFPDVELEPVVARLMPGPKWLLFGLANDELGYIIPKRQWDKSPPYAYGRDGGQYGEINSCGPEVAPIIMEALRRRIAEVNAVPPGKTAGAAD